MMSNQNNLLKLMWDIEELKNKINHWLQSNPTEHGEEVEQARDFLYNAKSKLREYIDYSYTN